MSAAGAHLASRPVRNRTRRVVRVMNTSRRAPVLYSCRGHRCGWSTSIHQVWYVHS